jgi:hypothetical protein
MRASRLILSVATVAAAFLCLSAGAAGARPACSSKGSRTVLATKSARIFTKRAIVRPRYHVTRWYGCMYRYDRRFRLATVGEPGIFVTAVRPIRLAGRFVGYSDFYEGPAGGTLADIHVRDLRSGREVFRHQAGEPDATDNQGPVQDLELKPNGSIAWIEATKPVSPQTQLTYRVLERAAGGQAVTLDEGPDVAPRSLAVSASTVYWTRAGVPRSALLG